METNKHKKDPNYERIDLVTNDQSISSIQEQHDKVES